MVWLVACRRMSLQVEAMLVQCYLMRVVKCDERQKVLSDRQKKIYLQPAALIVATTVGQRARAMGQRQDKRWSDGRTASAACTCPRSLEYCGESGGCCRCRCSWNSRSGGRTYSDLVIGMEAVQRRSSLCHWRCFLTKKECRRVRGWETQFLYEATIFGHISRQVEFNLRADWSGN